MNNSQPGPSNFDPLPVVADTMTSEEDSSSIPFVDSPDTPPMVNTPQSAAPPPVVNIRKASIAAQQQLHDGIILLITSDSESQRSPSNSIAQHPLSEFYLLPLPQDALTGNRRYSLQDRDRKSHHNERKASCPDTELRMSPDRRSSCSNRRSEIDISKDRLTPTSFSSRRSSNASACHSRRSSACSTSGHHHSRRRSSNCTACSRRSSNSSRRSSTASHRSSPSRRSSNCSRRSSHFDSDEENFHHHHHHHGGHHRGSRNSLGGASPLDVRRASHVTHRSKEEVDEEREELEAGGIPPRHRKIIIMIIGSVSIFILVMSVVLIAVSLTLSPTIDDLVRKGNEEIYRSMSAGASTSSPPTEDVVVANNTTPASSTPG